MNKMRKGSVFILLVVSFLLGWALHVSSLVSSTHLSNPHNLLLSPAEPPSFLLASSHGFYVAERHSPSDFLNEQSIHVYDDSVVIEGKFIYATFLDTNSMDPVLDEQAHALQRVPTAPDELSLGDIIAFEVPGQPFPIVHRIVEIGSDEQGWYCITKGDNVDQRDPFRVRFDDVKGVIVAIFY